MMFNFLSLCRNPRRIPSYPVDPGSVVRWARVPGGSLFFSQPDEATHLSSGFPEGRANTFLATSSEMAPSLVGCVPLISDQGDLIAHTCVELNEDELLRRYPDASKVI